MPSRPPLLIIQRPDSAIVVLRGSVNGPVSRSLRVVLTRLTRQTSDIVVDLQEVDSLDALGLLALLDISETCVAAGGSLRVMGPQRHIRRYLELTEADQCVPILESPVVVEPARQPVRLRYRVLARRGRLLEDQARLWWSSVWRWTS